MRTVKALLLASTALLAVSASAPTASAGSVDQPIVVAQAPAPTNNQTKPPEHPAVPAKPAQNAPAPQHPVQSAPAKPPQNAPAPQRPAQNAPAQPARPANVPVQAKPVQPVHPATIPVQAKPVQPVTPPVPVQAKPVQPVHPATIPVQAKPVQPVTPTTVPVQAKPVQPVTPTTVPVQAKPVQPVTPTTVPVQAKPVQPVTPTTVPVQAKPVQPVTPTTVPVQAKPVQPVTPTTVPVQAKPVQPVTPTTVPVQAKPVQPVTPTTVPVQAKPVQPVTPTTVPVQAKPVQPVTPTTVPAQVTPVQPVLPTNVPVQPKPVQPIPTTVVPANPTPVPVVPANVSPINPVAPQPLKPRDAGDFIRRDNQQPSRGMADILKQRQETRDGNRIVIREGDRLIVRDGNTVIIRHNEADRFAIGARDVRVDRQGNETLTVVERPDGVRIVSITDPDGHLIRRVRREANGQEIVIIDNRFAGSASGFFVDLPPVVVRGPRERYIMDGERATRQQMFALFAAPPVERINRRYSLEQVRYSTALRDRMPRVDLDVNFDSGSWQLTPDQVARLSILAEGLNGSIQMNAREVFMIEGHTDATGSADDNLSLSDRRAESVAVALTTQFHVPSENLVTQGYGAQNLKIPTRRAERANRRVAVRRITPLIDQAAK